MSLEWNTSIVYLMIMLIVCAAIMAILSIGWVIYDKCRVIDSEICNSNGYDQTRWKNVSVNVIRYDKISETSAL